MPDGPRAIDRAGGEIPVRRAWGARTLLALAAGLVLGRPAASLGAELAARRKPRSLKRTPLYLRDADLLKDLRKAGHLKEFLAGIQTRLGVSPREFKRAFKQTRKLASGFAVSPDPGVLGSRESARAIFIKVMAAKLGVEPAALATAIAAELRPRLEELMDELVDDGILRRATADGYLAQFERAGRVTIALLG